MSIFKSLLPCFYLLEDFQEVKDLLYDQNDLINALYEKVSDMSVNTDALTAAVADLSSKIDAVEAFIATLPTGTGNPADDQAVSDATNAVKAASDRLSAIVNGPAPVEVPVA